MKASRVIAVVTAVTVNLLIVAFLIFWGRAAEAAVADYPSTEIAAPSTRHQHRPQSNEGSPRLPDFSVPRVIHIVSALPRDAIGKVARYALAASYAAAAREQGAAP